jgi:hypothetical protein
VSWVSAETMQRFSFAIQLLAFAAVLSATPTAQPSFVTECSAGTYSVGGVCTLAPVGKCFNYEDC